MRKLWNLMLAALIIFGAVACTENNGSVDDNGNNSGTACSFVAEVNDFTTRSGLTYDEAAKVWKNAWEGDETIVITHDEREYKFTNTKEEPKKFTCATEGVRDITGKSVALKLTTEALSTVGAKGLSVDMTFKSFDPSKTVKLDANNSFLHYTYNGTGKVAFEMNFMAFVPKSGKSGSITIENVKGDNFVSFIPGDKSEATLKCSINGTLCKEVKLSLKSGVVYELGTLTDPKGEDEGTGEGEGEGENAGMVYLLPGVWAEADAWYAAYFFNSNDQNATVVMTDEDKDGFFECAVPAGMEKMIFCRMNPKYPEFGWNDETVTDRVWNQTADLEIGVDPNNYYYIHDWEVGLWGTKEGYDKPAPTAPWALAGTFNDWGNLAMEFTTVDNIFVAKNVTLTAEDSMKVKEAKSWDVCFGRGIENLKANCWMTVNKTADPDLNITIAEAGTYDIYFEYLGDKSKLYLMTAGTDYTTATQQGDAPADGGSTDDGTTDDGGVTDGTTNVYLVPNADWKQDGAWFAAYFFNSNDKNASAIMTDEDRNGIYECAVPAGMEKMLFSRMNPAYTEFGWDVNDNEGNVVEDHVWNQTVDLTIGVDPDNYFHITSWNNGVWGTKDGFDASKQPSEWALIGSLSSTEWTEVQMNCTSTAGLFTVKSVTVVADYSPCLIKKYGDTDWTIKYGGGIDYLIPGNYMTVYENGSDITITKAGTYDFYFDLNNNRLYVVNAGSDYSTATEQTTDGPTPDPSTITWGLCGAHNSWGDGGADITLTWDDTAKMFVAKSATLSGEFKVRANNSWNLDYGSGNAITVDATEGTTLYKKGGNSTVASGTYDVYFDKDNLLIWVKTPGSAAPAKS